MATRTPDSEANGVDTSESVVDIPADREYADASAAELDDALEAAVRAAEAAGKDTLATRLRAELGSHYYEEQLDL